MFIVTKKFVSGVLKGITINDISPVSFEIGKKYGGRGTGSRYLVTNCKGV
jgi:hypothetical protein